MKVNVKMNVVTALSAFLIQPVIAQQRPNFDLQLPDGQGSYPTGSVFIANIDTVWTAAGDPVPGVSILIRDGIIRAIGANVSAPNGVRVIDGAGLQAMPGIVDEHSHIAISATNEGTAPVVPEVRVLDALDPESYGIYQALSGGVTTARVMHGSSNPIGGQSAVIKTRWGMEAGAQLLIPGAPRFVKFALGENVTRKSQPQNASSRFPASRPGVEAVYVQAFTAARRYQAEWNRYRANPRAYRVPPRRDLRLEALVDIMEGRIRIHAHSYRSDEILMLMRIAERFGFKIDVFTHVLEGYRVATEMAEHGAAGSTFSDWWQYKREAFDAVPHNATIMARHGVLTGINSDIPWLQSFMHLEIPKPVKYGGATKLEALQMLTLNPARMMYLDHKIGSLEVGKEGDVVLLTASPFNSYARVEKTIVDGIVYYDASDEPGTRDQPFNAFPDVRAVAPTAPMTSMQPAIRAAEENGNGAASAGGTTVQGQGQVFALTGATVHAVSGPPIQNGAVVFRDGRILEVGPVGDVSIPAGATRIDVRGKHVYPGMIDPLTTIGLLEFGAVGQATDQGELGQYNPHIRAIVAVMPHYPSLNVARANGITTVHTAQTSGIVQGTGAVIAFNDGDTWEKVAVKPEAALLVNFPAPREGSGDADNWLELVNEDDVHAGIAPAPERGAMLDVVEAEARDTWDQDEEPTPRLTGGRMEELVQFFRRARVYTANPSVSDDPTAPFEPNVWGGESVLLDAMMPAMRGEMPVFFRADSEWQIKTLFVFADSFPEIKPAVVGGSEAWKVAGELARRRMPVIITSAYTPSGNLDESLTANYRNASVLEAAGVTFAFGTGSDADVRNLPYHAARSVAYGLAPDAGLRSVTLNPASILGIDAGSLDVGKRADLLVTDGDPLQMLTTIDRMWVGGREVDPRDNKHDQLFREFIDRGRP